MKQIINNETKNKMNKVKTRLSKARFEEQIIQKKRKSKKNGKNIKEKTKKQMVSNTACYVIGCNIFRRINSHTIINATIVRTNEKTS
jgi:ketol-acid reductoisomerase